MTTAAGYEFQSEFMRNLAAKYSADHIAEALSQTMHEAAGRAKGEAGALLLVLEVRGREVPDNLRDRDLECTDVGQVDSWLRRATTATTIDDVIHE